jgi:hypothetical protein
MFIFYISIRINCNRISERSFNVEHKYLRRISYYRIGNNVNDPSQGDSYDMNIYQLAKQ